MLPGLVQTEGYSRALL
ncbi:hypothetical protein [Micromonospora sp. NPDC049102]